MENDKKLLDCHNKNVQCLLLDLGSTTSEVEQEDIIWWINYIEEIKDQAFPKLIRETLLP